MHLSTLGEGTSFPNTDYFSDFQPAQRPQLCTFPGTVHYRVCSEFTHSSTIFHTPPGIHRAQVKEITAFTQPHRRCASALGALGVTDPGKHPIHWSCTAGRRQEQHCPASCSSLTLNTPAKSDNGCKAVQGSWD